MCVAIAALGRKPTTASTGDDWHPPNAEPDTDGDEDINAWITPRPVADARAGTVAPENATNFDFAVHVDEPRCEPGTIQFCVGSHFARADAERAAERTKTRQAFVPVPRSPFAEVGAVAAPMAQTHGFVTVPLRRAWGMRGGLKRGGYAHATFRDGKKGGAIVAGGEVNPLAKLPHGMLMDIALATAVKHFPREARTRALEMVEPWKFGKYAADTCAHAEHWHAVGNGGVANVFRRHHMRHGENGGGWRFAHVRCVRRGGEPGAYVDEIRAGGAGGKNWTAAGQGGWWLSQARRPPRGGFVLSKAAIDNAAAQRIARQLDRVPKTKAKAKQKQNAAESEEMQKAQSAFAKQRPSVISICIDSVSWAAASLYFPSLLRRLTQLRDANATTAPYRSFVFKRFTAHRGGTAVNFGAFLTGMKMLPDWREETENAFFSLKAHYLWEHFQNEGFVTAGGHSISSKATEDRVTRFRQSQPDFGFDFGERMGHHNAGPLPRNKDRANDVLARYARARQPINATALAAAAAAIAPLPHDRVNASLTAAQLGILADRVRCLGARSNWRLMLGAARDFARACAAPGSAPGFFISKSNENHHNDQVVLRSMEGPLLAFVDRLAADARADAEAPPPILVVHADHGNRLIPAESEQIMEPMLFMLVPTRVLGAYPDRARALAANQDRVLSQYDLHATLAHFALLDRARLPADVARRMDPAARSALAAPLPRGRSCGDAHVKVKKGHGAGTCDAVPAWWPKAEAWARGMNVRRVKLGYEFDFAAGAAGDPALVPALRAAVRAMNVPPKCAAAEAATGKAASLTPTSFASAGKGASAKGPTLTAAQRNRFTNAAAVYSVVWLNEQHKSARCVTFALDSRGRAKPTLKIGRKSSGGVFEASLTFTTRGGPGYFAEAWSLSATMDLKKMLASPTAFRVVDSSVVHLTIYNVYDRCVPQLESPKWCACRIASLNGMVPREDDRARVVREEHPEDSTAGPMGDPLAR